VEFECGKGSIDEEPSEKQMSSLLLSFVSAAAVAISTSLHARVSSECEVTGMAVEFEASRKYVTLTNIINYGPHLVLKPTT